MLKILYNLIFLTAYGGSCFLADLNEETLSHVNIFVVQGRIPILPNVTIDTSTHEVWIESPQIQTKYDWLLHGLSLTEM